MDKTHKLCELVWGTDRPCTAQAKHKIKVIIHSGIYSGVFELNNSYKYFDICDRHLDLVKDDKNVRVLKRG